jgi:glycogen synthase kinase 3 beta
MSDGKTYIHFVSEVMPDSLRGLISKAHDMRQSLDPLLVKAFIYQLFAGLAYLHSNGIVHRDMKTGNCLVDARQGRLKIIDFGSAKRIDKGTESATYIASRIYRAPELLLGCSTYNEKIDIWAAGCIIAEIILDAIPMFQGSSNEDQLVQIMRIMGKPTEEDESSFDHPVPFPSDVEQICSLQMSLPLGTDPDLLAMLAEIFRYDPAKRPSARDCMKYRYFDELFERNARFANGNPVPELHPPWDSIF